MTRTILGAALVWILTAATSGAQAVAGSQVSGVVKDSSGAVLPGVDVPRPPALTLALGRKRVEVARASPVAVARDENLPGEMPSLGHRRMSCEAGCLD